MSEVNYVKCDICGENIEAMRNSLHYQVIARGHRWVVGSVFTSPDRVDVCESCWDRIKDEVAAKERDA